MSFLASFAKSGMETQEERDNSLRARVASTSIWAQKIVDEAEAPELRIQKMLCEHNLNVKPLIIWAHSDLKEADRGILGSHSAAKAYAQAAKDRRDALLAKYNQP